jgi:hypothetical protein
MDLAVVGATKGHREFVADLAAQSLGLGEPQMVRVGGLSATDQARLFGPKPEVLGLARHFSIDAGYLCSRCECIAAQVARPTIVNRNLSQLGAFSGKDPLAASGAGFASQEINRQ